MGDATRGQHDHAPSGGADFDSRDPIRYSSTCLWDRDLWIHENGRVQRDGTESRSYEYLYSMR
jgi:hypothetical protein